MISVKITKRSKSRTVGQVSGVSSVSTVSDSSGSEALSLLTAIGGVLYPVNEKGERVKWNSPEVVAVKSEKDFFSIGTVSARGLSKSEGGTGITEDRVSAMIAEAMDGYSGKAHTHAIKDITGLLDELSGKANATHTHNYAAVNHTHNYAAVDHLHDTVYSKLGHTHDYAASSHTHSQYLTAHQSLANYYTKTEVDRLAASIVSDMFEKVNVGTAASPKYVIKAKYDLYSVGTVSAMGFSETAGGEGIDESRVSQMINEALGSYSGKAHTHAIKDITGLLDELSGKANATHTHSYAAVDHTHSYAAVDHTHSYAAVDHTHNYAASSHTHTIANITNLQTTLDGKAASSHTHSQYLTAHQSLAAYATQAWVEAKKYLTTHQDISGKVDKVSGYALSKNDFTDAYKTKLDGIATNANNYSLPTASASVLGGVKIGANISISNGVISTHDPYTHPTATATTIAAATGNVLSAVTVNGLGHVTSVSSKTLAAADIPNLAWSKITSGKPTTLSGYGITDLVAKYTSATTGTSNLPVYLSNGVITQCSSVGEAFLSWGGKSYAGGVGVLDAAMCPILGGANRFAGAFADGIMAEYSSDSGATWQDYGLSAAQKTALTIEGVGTSMIIGKGNKTANARLRVTLNTGACSIYTVLSKVAIYVSTSGSQGCKVLMERALESTPDTWVTCCEAPVSGWSGWNILSFSSFTTYGNVAASHYGRIRFTFSHTGNPTQSTGLQVLNILGFGGVGWNTPTTLAKTGHLYSIDSSFNASFPSMVSASSLKIGDCILTWDSTKKVLNFSQSIASSGQVSAKGASTTSGGTGITESRVSQMINEALGSYSGKAHTHAIKDITGLLDELSGKANATHTHSYAAVDHLHDTVYSKLGHTHDYAASGHTHTIANVTGLQSALEGKAASGHTHTIANITNLQTTLDGKAASSHTHTFASLTSKPTTLSGYGITDAAASSHTHSNYLTAITKAQVEAVLTGNVASHTHSYLPLSGGSMANTNVVTNLNADLLDGVHLKDLNLRTHYGTLEGTAGWFKINIRSTKAWMLYFRVRIYQNYDYFDIDFSGYKYSNQCWYNPKARLVSSSASSIQVCFGYDSTTDLWVGIPARSYTGISIVDIVNGYAQIDTFANLFEITKMSELTGTIQSTLTLSRGASLTDNVATATALQTSRTLWGQSFNGTGNVSGRWELNGVAEGSLSIFDGTSYRAIQSYASKPLALNPIGNNVGIGTTSPGYKLHVNGTLYASGAATLASALAVTGASTFTGQATANGGLKLPYGGSSWIGMATRTAQILGNIQNSASSAHSLFMLKNSTGSAVCFGGLGTSLGFYGFYKSRIDNNTNGTDWQTTWNADDGILYHSGGMIVGVGMNVNGGLSTGGATSIGSTLAVTGAATLSSTLTTSGKATLNSLEVTNAATLKSTLAVTGTTQLTGNTGIGCASNSDFKLTVKGGTYIDGALTTSGGYDTWGLFRFTGEKGFWLQNKKTELQFQYHENNSFVATRASLSAEGVFFAPTGIYSNGYVSAKGLSTSSDIRLKTDIKPFTLPIAVIANAPSVAFRWKENGKEAFGGIAQYWHELHPALAPVHTDGKHLTMQYGNIAYLSCVTLGRELLSDRKRIHDLERRVNELESLLKKTPF